MKVLSIVFAASLAVLACAALCENASPASGPAGTQSQPTSRRVIISLDFDSGKGVGGQFARNWHPLDGKVASLTIEAPAGAGNDSKGAATCRVLGKVPYASNELPMHKTPIEQPGWDGSVTFRIYNSGFESFYAMYLPAWPSDVTFHRAVFNVPKGEWATVTLPFDKFLYQGRRPRRGTTMEYFDIVGQTPDSDKAFFQFDDVVIYETPSAVKPTDHATSNPAQGVIYSNDFDDPRDFDVEAYYPTTKNCNIFRVPGGLDAAGKPIASPADDGPGCMKIQAAGEAKEFRAGRRITFAAKDTVIEFDCLLTGAIDFSVGARTNPGNGRCRAYTRPVPEEGKWTHVTIRADEMVPFGQPASVEAAATRPSAGKEVFELNFAAYPKDAKALNKTSVLIDNLKIHTAEAGK